MGGKDGRGVGIHHFGNIMWSHNTFWHDQSWRYSGSMSTEEDVGLEEVMVTVMDKPQEGTTSGNSSRDIGYGGRNGVWQLIKKNNPIHLWTIMNIA